MSVKMRPYGIRSEYQDEAYGPTTKFSGSMSQRRKYRRRMHRQGRIDGRKEVESQFEDMEQEEIYGCGCAECYGRCMFGWQGEPHEAIPEAKPKRSNIGAEIAKALIGICP